MRTQGSNDQTPTTATAVLSCCVTYTRLVNIFNLFHDFCLGFTQQLEDRTIVTRTGYEWVLKHRKQVTVHSQSVNPFAAVLTTSHHVQAGSCGPYDKYTRHESHSSNA